MYRQNQQQILQHLLKKAEATAFGSSRRFASIETYREFCEQIPLQFYGDIQEHIDLIKSGKPDILWPGKVNRFAVSAGTTGQGKHLPLSDERLKSDRRFMQKVALSYLKQCPNIFKLMGSHVSIPGSLEKHEDFLIGEISGFSALHIPFWLRPFQMVNPASSAFLPFKQKFDRILDEAVKRDVRIITAVPSWILTLFQQALERTDAAGIAELWPNLKVIVAGGVKLGHYRAPLESLTSLPGLDYVETYGASEGYFGFSDDLERDDLKLVTDNGIFYEFIPHPLPGYESLSIQETVPLWEVKPGVPYALVVSTNAGLWRYCLNDVIEFTSVHPPRIVVKERLGDVLDTYGEALHAQEAGQALKEAAAGLDIRIGAFSIGVVPPSEREIPYHIWFVQLFGDPGPEAIGKFAVELDTSLQHINRHYAIRRESNALGKPVIKAVNQQKINAWLDKKGNSKAQGKLPPVLKDEQDITFFRE